MPTVDASMRPLAIALIMIVCGVAVAQNPVIEARQFSSPPTIDGVVDEQEWEEATRVEGFTLIANGSPEPHRTRAWIGYDTQNIYIAYICEDPNPTLLRATEYRRGANLSGDDRVIFVINAFATQRGDDMSEFEVSAGGGSRSSIAGGRAAKREWQGDWIAKARITDSGYEVEASIPWAILPLPGAGVRNIDVNLGRFYQRQQLIAAYSNIGPEERSDRHAVWLGVNVPQVAQAGALQALPYQVLGYDDEGGSVVFNTGVDMRYRVNPQLTVLSSINPDFQNLENAVLNLEFSRFERLADERRPFFVEGGDFFRMGGSARPFASQRIGPFDVGGKVFGKITDDSVIGALTTIQFGEAVNAAVRYRKTFDQRSHVTVGWVYSDREGEGITNHAANTELMIDGERWGVGVIHAITEDSDVGAGKRTDVDVFYHDGAVSGSFGWQQISPNYLPRIGFAPRRGLKGWQGRLEYEKAFTSGGIVDASASVSFFDSDHWDGSGVYFDNRSVNAGINLRNGLSVNAGTGVSNFKGSIDKITWIWTEYPSNDPYQSLGVGSVFGSVGGDRYLRYDFFGRYRFPFKLSVFASLGFEALASENNHLHIIGTSFELSEFQSIAGRMVMRDSKVNWYLSYRQSGNFGAEYYVIIGDPNAPTFQKRVVLKAVFPFEIRW